MDKWVVEFGQSDELVSRIYAGGDDAVKAICDYAAECKAHCRSLVAFAKSCKTCWIPVGERLPEATEEVLVSTSSGIRVAWLTNLGHWHGFWLPLVDVTHWMPLPSPPTDAK